MKRLLSKGLVVVRLLCGCTGQPEPNDPANTSENTLADGNTEKLEPNDAANASENTLTDGQAQQPVLETKEDATEFIRNTKINGIYVYLHALGCMFAKAEDIPARFYFYNGVGEKGQFTQEEKTFLVNAFKQKNPNNDERFAHSATRLPVAKINAALSVLGVTIEDIQIPDRWVYYDETDSYYFWVTDAYGVDGWFVTNVEKGDNGTVAIYWETKGFYWGDATREEPLHGAKMVMTMQAMPDGSYRILSNVLQEP